MLDVYLQALERSSVIKKATDAVDAAADKPFDEQAA